MKSRFWLISVAFLPSACSSTGEYPSLAPRPYEKNDAVPAPAGPPPVSDLAVVERINAAVGLAESGVAQFNTAIAAAESAVNAAKGGMGSESWVAAQMAISRAERTRGPAQNALSQLDAEKRVILLGPPSADRDALEVALVRVGGIDAAQSAAVARLIARVGR